MKEGEEVFDEFEAQRKRAVETARIVRRPRNGFYPSGGLGEISDEAWAAVKKMYVKDVGTKRHPHKTDNGQVYDRHSWVKKLLSRKGGFWTVYLRSDFEIPFFLDEDKARSKPEDGFCAVYMKPEKFQEPAIPRTMIIGKTVSDNPLEDPLYRTLEALQRDMFEENRVFNWIPSDLTSDNDQFQRKMAGVTAGALLAIGAMGSFYHSSGYGSANSEDLMYWCLLGGSCVVPVLADLATPKVFVRKLGELADLYRMRNVPRAAENYQFGIDAEQAVEAEYKLVQEEIRKARMHEAFLDRDCKISQHDFLAMYNFFMQENEKHKLISARVVELAQYISQKDGLLVDLETAVKVFGREHEMAS